MQIYPPSIPPSIPSPLTPDRLQGHRMLCLKACAPHRAPALALTPKTQTAANSRRGQNSSMWWPSQWPHSRGLNQNQNQNRLYCYQNPRVLCSTQKIVPQTARHHRESTQLENRSNAESTDLQHYGGEGRLCRPQSPVSTQGGDVSPRLDSENSGELLWGDVFSQWTPGASQRASRAFCHKARTRSGENTVGRACHTDACWKRTQSGEPVTLLPAVCAMLFCPGKTIIIITTTIIIIIMIIIIAFKGAIRDFLQSPHSATNCLQHVRSSGPGAIVCKSRATHRALITCKCHVTCHLVRRDSSAFKFDRVEIAFISALFYWLNH